MKYPTSIKVRLKSGDVLAVRSYGFGFVDARGNYYARRDFKILEVLCS